MHPRPTAAVFDVMGTIFSLEALRPRLVSAGLAGETLELWFASFQRDGASLAAMGDYRAFYDVAASALAGILEERGRRADPATVERVMRGFAEVDVFDDLAPSSASSACAAWA
jgi:2-haloacid dehalogenase